ncbi:hypothetical protein ACFQ2B_38295 [Streptomyces stramineus]
MITDVTTTKAAVHDSKALPGILANLEHRDLLSKEHFVDGGYLSVALKPGAQQSAHQPPSTAPALLGRDGVQPLADVGRLRERALR